MRKPDSVLQFLLQAAYENYRMLGIRYDLAFAYSLEKQGKSKDFKRLDIAIFNAHREARAMIYGQEKANADSGRTLSLEN